MEDLDDDIVNGIATADVTETLTPEPLHVSDIDIAINATRIERWLRRWNLFGRISRNTRELLQCDSKVNGMMIA